MSRCRVCELFGRDAIVAVLFAEEVVSVADCLLLRQLNIGFMALKHGIFAEIFVSFLSDRSDHRQHSDQCFSRR